MTVQEITKQALSLNMHERAEVAEAILKSIDNPNDAEVTTLWAKEAERRRTQVESGAVELISLSDVFARLDRKFA